MRLFTLFTLLTLTLSSPALAQTVNVDNPADSAIVTGADVISGWTCEANTLQIRFDSGGLITLPYGGTRGDTVGICGDDNNGFALAWNWALLGPGQHTLEILKDGVVDATRTVEVIDLGTEFLSGASGLFTLPDFPAPGQSVDVEWMEGKQNFSIVNFDAGGPAPQIMPGLYIGEGQGTQRNECRTFALDSTEECDIRLNVEEVDTGVFQLTPTRLVDFQSSLQCSVEDQIAFMMEVRCDQPAIVTYRACDAVSIINGSFSFEASDDPLVTISGSCSGTQCSGVVSSRTTLDPQCSHPEISWTADLATQ